MSNFNEEKLKLVKEALSKSKREISTDWLDIKDTHNFEHSGDNLRKYSTGWKLLEEWGLVDFDNLQPINTDMPNYKETHELVAGGLQKSDKLIKMNAQQAKDVDYILKAHGFDAGEWELISAKNNIWNVNSKLQGVQTLYSSKITVKPKVNGLDIGKLVDKLTKNLKPYKRNNKVSEGKNLLELAFTDLHFGVNSLDYYKETLDETIDLITSKEWDTIYLPIGSDLLHNNDLSKGLTANGTPIEKVDMETAWEEAYRFYSTLLEYSLDNATNVVAKYVCGNHDRDMSFGLVKSLSKVYTEVDWDTSVFNKKLFTWKDVAILFLHGDRGTSRVVKSIYKEYGKLIADKKVVEIHSGDKHHTKTEDSHGVVFRILPTGAQTDLWHAENSFSGSMQTFHLFEYAPDKLKTIYHV